VSSDGAARTPVIDTHLHFWDLATYGHDEWLRKQPAIHRSFLPADLEPELERVGVDLGVLVEAAHDHRLNLWWLSLAAEVDWIGAVVVGAELEQEDLTARFDEYAGSEYFVGMRTTPAGPPERWAGNPATERGLREMVRRDLSLDLLVGHASFGAVAEIAARYPSLRIILDHCAHPPIREGQLDAWREQLAPLAAHENIWVKYSSLLLYSYPDSGQERLRPVAQFLLERFGVDRMAWGSNWPVELLGGSYEQAYRAMTEAVAPLTVAERSALMGGTAARFYKVR
jgi:L-fuconolactonase